MYCPECKEEFDGKFCPQCGCKLIEKPADQANFAFNLGDANAFAGDVSISVNNTKIERQKTDSEIKADALCEYRQLCKQTLSKGIVTNYGRTCLEDDRIRLGISKDDAQVIFESVKASLMRHSKNVLGKIQQVSLNQIIKLMDIGKFDTLRASLGRLRTMAEKYDADEVQCYFWMILAGLDPKECINEYENRESDGYWQSYWSAMAYINTGDTASAEELISNLEAWQNMPFSNIALLAAANSLYEYWKDASLEYYKEQAEAFAEEGASGNTDLIDKFANAILLLLKAIEPDQLAEPTDLQFQFNYVLKGITDLIRLTNVMQEIPIMPKIDLLPE